MAEPNNPLLNLYSNIAFVIYGMAMYEAGTSLQLYFKAFTKSRLTSPIFLLLTIAVFAMAGSTFLQVIININFDPFDLFYGPAEYGTTLVGYSLSLLGSNAYFLGGTLRTRVLLGKFPKVLYCIYVMVVVEELLAIVMTGVQFSLWTYAFNAVAPSVEAVTAISAVGGVAIVLQVVLANTLMISFLYPIFAKAEKKKSLAVKEILALSDVQKGVYVCALAFLALGLIAQSPAMATATVHLWYHTQNSQFLRLSYVNMGEILVKQRESLTNRPQGSIVASNTVSSV